MEMADQQAAATLALEKEAEGEVVGALEARLDGARRTITAAYVGAFGATDADAVGGPVLDRLLEESRRVLSDAMTGQGEGEVLARYVTSATQLGAEHAAEVVDEATTLDAPEPDLSAAVTAPTLIAGALDGALAVLTVATVLSAGHTGAMAAVGSANKGANALRALARTSVNEAHSAGVREVADRYDYGRVWVAERDGCVHCLAYAGEIAWEGADFPTGRTFGDKPVGWATELPDPPLHPHCRCATLPHTEQFGEAFPNALKREARRSIAKGWSLDTESQAVRLRAAERLLKSGPDLPRSVVAGARRALSRGEFASRRVPTGS